MARNASDINPNDTYPRRNLPPGAENWGRTVEDRIIALEKASLQARAQAQADRRLFSSLLDQLVVSTGSPGWFTASKSEQVISSSDSTSAGIYTVTSVTVPTGALTATLTVKGTVTATNDSNISPPETLDLTAQAWYSHLPSGTPWEPGLIGGDNRFSASSETLLTDATATTTAIGTTTVPVTPGYTLLVGTDSRFAPTGTVQTTNNASTFVVGSIQFNYPV